MVIALSLCLLFCACKGIDNELEIKFPQSFDQNDATDLDAIKLYNEALKNFTEQDNYMRTQYYSFDSDMFDMQIKTIRKINGDKIYNEEVVIGKGVMSLNEGKKVYFDGDNAATVSYDDSQQGGKGVFVAVVLATEGKTALVEMRNRFRDGETLKVLSPHLPTDLDVTVRNLRDAEGTPVADAKLVQQQLYFDSDLSLTKGDILYRRSV